MREMVDAKDKLRELGHNGWIHPHYEDFVAGKRKDHLARWHKGEKAALKRENDYLKVHYKNIVNSDAILVVNLEKKGIKNYIGGNVLIEMGQAYVHDKKIYLLNDLPRESLYLDEIDSMDPVCLHGDLKSIK